ncbi:MAG: hypothetical protein HGB03_04265 [Candidatus Yonathbacteria bacterium]|nr:hypothetical protein [Candidatus Yonathbacteria bacterium]NTW47557.1 hypothetical protein [Candidatus Yonathbacteria bacterium]
MLRTHLSVFFSGLIACLFFLPGILSAAIVWELYDVSSKATLGTYDSYTQCDIARSSRNMAGGNTSCRSVNTPITPGESSLSNMQTELEDALGESARVNLISEQQKTSGDTDLKSDTPSSSSSSYELLEPSLIGGTETTNASNYFETIYVYAIGAAGVLAVLMFAIGGIQYMFGGANPASKSKGVAHMSNAVWGIILALSAYLILNTINPDLVDLQVTLPEASIDAEEGEDYDAEAPTEAAGYSPTETNSSGGGSCGGMVVTSAVQTQCSLASSALSSMLSCMHARGVTATVTSLTSSRVGSDLSASRACCGNASCVHATNSCHYGCEYGSFAGEPGYSHAVDIAINGMSQTEWCAIASAAKSCGSGTIWGPADACSGAVKYWEGHGTHLHVSTRSCNH